MALFDAAELAACSGMLFDEGFDATVMTPTRGRIAEPNVSLFVTPTQLIVNDRERKVLSLVRWSNVSEIKQRGLTAGSTGLRPAIRVIAQLEQTAVVVESDSANSVSALLKAIHFISRSPTIMERYSKYLVAVDESGAKRNASLEMNAEKLHSAFAVRSLSGAIDSQVLHRMQKDTGVEEIRAREAAIRKEISVPRSPSADQRRKAAAEKARSVRSSSRSSASTALEVYEANYRQSSPYPNSPRTNIVEQVRREMQTDREVLERSASTQSNARAVSSTARTASVAQALTEEVRSSLQELQREEEEAARAAEAQRRRLGIPPTSPPPAPPPTAIQKLADIRSPSDDRPTSGSNDHQGVAPSAARVTDADAQAKVAEVQRLRDEIEEKEKQFQQERNRMAEEMAQQKAKAEREAQQELARRQQAAREAEELKKLQQAEAEKREKDELAKREEERKASAARKEAERIERELEAQRRKLQAEEEEKLRLKQIAEAKAKEAEQKAAQREAEQKAAEQKKRQEEAEKAAELKRAEEERVAKELAEKEFIRKEAERLAAEERKKEEEEKKKAETSTPTAAPGSPAFNDPNRPLRTSGDWVEKRAEDKRIYFVNTKEKRSTWKIEETPFASMPLEKSKLPVTKWVEREKDGKKYYLNVETKTTVWNLPAGGEVVGEEATVSSPKAPASPQRSEGSGSGKGPWVAKSHEGKTYYFNTETKERTWTKPAEFQTEAESDTGDWTEKKNADGRSYFVNTRTGERVWNKPGPGSPSSPASPKAPTTETSDGPRKVVWKAKKHTDGRTYYVNLETKKSVWVRPEGEDVTIEE